VFLRRRRPLRAFAVAAWLLEGCLHKLVLVVASVASREPLERWVFNVQREDDAESGEAARCGARWLLCAAAAHWPGSSDASKGRSDVSAQIAAIIRQVRRSLCVLVKASYDKTFPAQITASVTFLPLLDEPCASCAGLVVALATYSCAGAFDLLVYTDAASAVPSEWCVRVCRHYWAKRLSRLHSAAAQGGERSTPGVGRRGGAAARILHARPSRGHPGGVQGGRRGSRVKMPDPPMRAVQSAQSANAGQPES